MLFLCQDLPWFFPNEVRNNSDLLNSMYDINITPFHELSKIFLRHTMLHLWTCVRILFKKNKKPCSDLNKGLYYLFTIHRASFPISIESRFP